MHIFVLFQYVIIPWAARFSFFCRSALGGCNINRSIMLSSVTPGLRYLLRAGNFQGIHGMGQKIVDYGPSPIGCFLYIHDMTYYCMIYRVKLPTLREIVGVCCVQLCLRDLYQ